MIGKLKGRVDEVSEDEAIIDVGGVGYLVFASARTLAALVPNSAAELVIETHVREDHFHLYGFLSHEEREWFRLLLSVQRVGAKMALAIQSVYAPPQLMQIILAKDIAAMSRVSGVGAKLAERIVAELKDKVLKLPTGPTPLPAHSGATPVKGGKKATASSAAPVAASNVTEDAISALVHLGYGRSEAYAAAARATTLAGDKPTLDAIIKLSLKELAR